MGIKDDAKKIVDAFALRTTAGVWPHVQRTPLVADLKNRIDNPDLISSYYVNLCGPAAFLRNLANDNPQVYAQAVVDLFESGEASIGKRKIKPGKDLKAAAFVNTSPADWIPLASLRDDDNWFLDYQSEADAVSGITMPHTLADWFSKAGYKEVLNETNVFFTKDAEHAKRASMLYGRGYKVCLFINAQMLKASTQNDSSTTPDHWVVMASALSQNSVGGELQVNLKVHSWGQILSVPSTGTFSMKTFVKNYYGFVACKT